MLEVRGREMGGDWRGEGGWGRGIGEARGKGDEGREARGKGDGDEGR